MYEELAVGATEGTLIAGDLPRNRSYAEFGLFGDYEDVGGSLAPGVSGEVGVMGIGQVMENTHVAEIVGGAVALTVGRGAR